MFSAHAQRSGQVGLKYAIGQLHGECKHCMTADVLDDFRVLFVV